MLRWLAGLGIALAVGGLRAQEPPLAGDWIAGDAQAVVIERTVDGLHEVRVDGQVVARERPRLHEGRWATGFDATPAGASFMKARAGTLALRTQDGFLIWTQGTDYFDDRYGRHEHVRAWRRAGTAWPAFECAGEQGVLKFLQGPDFRASIEAVAPDGRRQRCELQLETMRYCPECRGLTDHLRYRITDRCEPDPNTPPAPGAGTMPKAGGRLVFNVYHSTFFSRIDGIGIELESGYTTQRCVRTP